MQHKYSRKVYQVIRHCSGYNSVWAIDENPTQQHQTDSQGIGVITKGTIHKELQKGDRERLLLCCISVQV
jgi:hypothetical protein